MELFKGQTQIRFMDIRLYTGVISLLLAVFALGLLWTKGLNLSLEFTGGLQMKVHCTTPIDPAEVRNQLEQQGFEGVRVQQYASVQDLLIRVAPDRLADKHQSQVRSLHPGEGEAEETAALKHLEAALKKIDPECSNKNRAFVGSELGEQLIEQGGLAILVSILATMIYISLRFEYRLALSAALGLVHDAILILGVFSLCGFEFDLATLASILAVLSYSLNDTIVVFDRVRENFRKIRTGSPVSIMNLSINQTLSRTIMTSWMTLLVVLALLFFGGQSLFGFSMAFFVGILIGTFSSIYVSGALALWLGLSRADLMPKQKTVRDLP